MCTRSQKPASEPDMNTAARENRNCLDISPAGGGLVTASAARLQAIHDLIRSGDYHVPAAAIADRMVERMLAERLRQAH
jgi:anti-sigma28 factor (negative regulator of flagellin synthesis)